MSLGRPAADSNPFDDPSVQDAVSGGSHYGGEDDPFETGSLAKYPSSTYSAQVEDDDETMYPTSTRNPAPADAMRIEELRRREQELDAREREITQRADHIQRYGRNNWPFCKCHPAVRLLTRESTPSCTMTSRTRSRPTRKGWC